MNTDLVATAVVRRAGKAVGVVDVDVVDNESRLVVSGAEHLVFSVKRDGKRER